jgi:hypothetical protein
MARGPLRSPDGGTAVTQFTDPTVCARCKEEIGPAELRYSLRTYHRPLCLRCIEEIRARRGAE